MFPTPSSHIVLGAPHALPMWSQTSASRRPDCSMTNPIPAKPDPWEERELTMRAQERFVEVAGKTL